jgi:hypothetical protein
VAFTEEAPVWTPDDEVIHALHIFSLSLFDSHCAADCVLDDSPVQAPNCEECNINFTFTRRRHHCRACGRVRPLAALVCAGIAKVQQ